MDENGLITIKINDSWDMSDDQVILIKNDQLNKNGCNSKTITHRYGDLIACFKLIIKGHRSSQLTRERVNGNNFFVLFKSDEVEHVVDALDAFDKFLVPFVDFIGHFPDYVQAIVPNLTPKQYGQIKTKINDRLRELGENRLAIKVHTTKDTMEDNRAYHDKSARLSAERKGK